MPDEKSGQAQTGQPDRKPTFDEYYAKGWETVEADEAEAAKKTTESPAGEKTPAQQLKEADCPDCPGGKFFKVIKHNGKDVGIKTEKEYNDYVQQGFDYTKKTQALAEERRKLESERTEYQKLVDRLERLEKGSAVSSPVDKGEPKPAAKPAQTPAEEEAKVFAEYGLDPEYASEFEKRLVRDVVKQKQDLQQSRELTQVIVLKEMTNTITGALREAVEEFPVDEIKDEQGNDLTGQFVIGEFKRIVADPANQKTPVKDLARMAVRSVHDMQQVSKGKQAEPSELTDDAFAARFKADIDRARKLGLVPREDADDLPPSITGRKASVPAADQQKTKPRFNGLSEAIDAGMEDPEIKALFGG